MSKVIISRVFPKLEALDNCPPVIEMHLDEDSYLTKPSAIKNVRYDITYTIRLSHSEFVKAFEE